MSPQYDLLTHEPRNQQAIKMPSILGAVRSQALKKARRGGPKSHQAAQPASLRSPALICMNLVLIEMKDTMRQM
jgi:hypothetical protein